MKKSTLMWIALFLFVAVLFAPAMVVASSDHGTPTPTGTPAADDGKDCSPTNPESACEK